MEACTRGLGRGYGKKQEILDSSRNLHTKQRTRLTLQKHPLYFLKVIVEFLLDLV